MNGTERTLTDTAKQIEKDFLLIGLPATLEDFLTSEEYETFRFALKGILRDNYNKHWEVMDQIAKKVDKIAAEAPALKQRAFSAMLRKESLNSKPKFIGFEAFTLDEVIQKVNEFVSSDKCEHFISAEFKMSKCAGANLYVCIVTYQTSISDENDSQKRCDSVKEFASEVRKTIEDTYQSLGGSEYFSFADNGFVLIEAVQNKLDEVLK